MVKYYGRARQRTGSVNTNQRGLKMSGCPSKVGRSIAISRYIQRRVNCMTGVCGAIMVHGVPHPRREALENSMYHITKQTNKVRVVAFRKKIYNIK